MTWWKSKIGVESDKLDGVGAGRIRRFPFLPIPFTTPSLMIQWKLGCRSLKQKRKNQPIASPRVEHCHRFILPLLLATLDRKRRSHKQNAWVFCFPDSSSSINTRLYRSTLLIRTPSLVKTSLYESNELVKSKLAGERWPGPRQANTRVNEFPAERMTLHPRTCIRRVWEKKSPEVFIWH